MFSGPGQNKIGSDGIGDTPYTIDANNTDRYPLIGPFSFFNAGTWNEITYYVHTVSNSTVSDFYFSTDNKLVSFNVTGPDDTVGFFRGTIPKRLLWCDDPSQWIVLVDDQQISPKVMEDENLTYLYFLYNQSTHQVQIIGKVAGVHDITVTDVAPSPNSVMMGETVTINVTVKNEGDFTETFNVTAYYDSTEIETQTVTNLGATAQETLTFTWNTSSPDVGDHTIKAVVANITDEMDTDDNTLTNGIVTVKAPTPSLWMQWWFWAMVAVVIVALAGTVYFLKKRKPPTPTAPPPSEGMHAMGKSIRLHSTMGVDIL